MKELCAIYIERDTAFLLDDLIWFAKNNMKEFQEEFICSYDLENKLKSLESHLFVLIPDDDPAYSLYYRDKAD